MAEVVREAGRAEGLSRAAGEPRAADAGAGGAGGDPAAACPECGTALAGDFCHACGEKRPESRDLSVRRFFSEAAQELTSVEHSKLFHTLRALLFRPGFLTNEWKAGRRRRYLKPLNLCLGTLALSFFAYSAYKPVSMFDVEKFVRADKRQETFQVFERFAAKKKLSLPEMFDRLADKWQRYVSVSTLLFIGGFALVLQTVFFLRRRYFVEHLVFSMHFVSFSTLVVLLLWPVYFFVGIKAGGGNLLIGLSKWLIDMVYMFFAVRSVYGLGVVKSVPASVVLVVGYFLSYALVLVGAFVAALISVGLS
ncbi:MAG TPA: DUF3667 domain-containing protein [Pyrinomonadaceae bacterium]